jgi:hypothetical protein
LTADKKAHSFVLDQSAPQGVTSDTGRFFMLSKYAILLDGGFGGPGGPAPAPTNGPAADLGATEPRDISVSLVDIGVAGPAKLRDLWNPKDLGVITDKLTQTINSHGAGLYRVQPQN